MSNDRLYLSSPHMSDEGYEQEYVKEAFDTNWIAPLGKNVDGFEQELAEIVGSKHAAALSAGTCAIHMALKACDLKEDDIVICQDLTFSATVNPILYEKAVPVFVDSEKDTWNMDPKYLEEALKKYPQAKAVVVVHLYGIPAKLDEIMEICKRYNVTLIEDAAESLGSTYKGRYTGTFGKYGIFSFNGNKIITTSGGGMLVSDDKERIEKVRFWSTQSREKERHYEHKEVGYNYRMSNIVAGIGRGQLKVLKDRILKKNQIFNFYKDAFKDIEDIEFVSVNKDSKPNYWLSSILLKGDIMPNDLIDELEKHNIESRPLWKPMHLQPVFSSYDYIGENVSTDLFEKGVCLPSDTKMTEEDLVNVTEIIKSLWR